MSEPLLISERAAARKLSVSERTLWGWRRAGIVPHVRVGRTVKYSVDSLRRWVAEREAESLHSPLPHKVTQATPKEV